MSVDSSEHSGASFEQRLLRFLAREASDERKSSDEVRTLSAAQRTLEGECLQDVVFRGREGEDFCFDLVEDTSKFRRNDSVLVGDGHDFEAATAMVYAGFDASQKTLRLRRSPYGRATVQLDVGLAYCVDRRPIRGGARLNDAVGAALATPVIAAALHGEVTAAVDAERLERAVEHFAAGELDASQAAAAAKAVTAEPLALIQGPPGTGKTRVLAEIVHALCSRGCRVVLTAFTHRALDNALLAVRRRAPEIDAIKLGRADGDGVLRQAGVRSMDVRDAEHIPARGAVVAGTCFALARLPMVGGFHYALIDEAAQLPIPHALAAMRLARRWVFLGDHQQLPPVVKADHADEAVTRSIFEHLAEHHESDLLEVTYRLNQPVCDTVSRLFYAGAIHPAAGVAERRMPFKPGGRFDGLLDPELGIVVAQVDHLQPGHRAPREARVVADLATELVCRHGVEPADIAVVSPFRAQARTVRSALQRAAFPGWRDVLVETIDRVQGQEREVVMLSLALGDPGALGRAKFFYAPNRLNVALSRARTKAIVVAARGAFTALPDDPVALRAAALFRRLWNELPRFDLSADYAPQGSSVEAT